MVETRPIAVPVPQDATSWFGGADGGRSRAPQACSWPWKHWGGARGAPPRYRLRALPALANAPREGWAVAWELGSPRPNARPHAHRRQHSTFEPRPAGGGTRACARVRAAASRSGRTRAPANPGSRDQGGCGGDATTRAALGQERGRARCGRRLELCTWVWQSVCCIADGEAPKKARRGAHTDGQHLRICGPRYPLLL